MELTINDFKRRFEQLEHDWKALRKLNKCVNEAVGVDMFDTSVFPCHYNISGDLIEVSTPKGIYSAAEEEFDPAQAIALVEAAVNDSERS